MNLSEIVQKVRNGDPVECEGLYSSSYLDLLLVQLRQAKDDLEYERDESLATPAMQSLLTDCKAAIAQVSQEGRRIVHQSQQVERLEQVCNYIT